ncbi:hypothetical protein Nans01_40840 [Nocardiopsis ansamitocini]|uniref:Uncharacterized protein n=1 Tax=Nocardiopsis ansamitocini TaxID=1670832 RepID=A0A9W6PA23_9ACTN|nr:hypothetical protein Nans01_40840 [Nocardiopsis ansamitocini]
MGRGLRFRQAPTGRATGRGIDPGTPDAASVGTRGPFTWRLVAPAARPEQARTGAGRNHR